MAGAGGRNSPEGHSSSAAGVGAARQGGRSGCRAGVFGPLLYLESSGQSSGLPPGSSVLCLLDDIRHLPCCQQPDLGGILSDLASVAGVVNFGREVDQVFCYSA